MTNDTQYSVVIQYIYLCRKKKFTCVVKTNYLLYNK